MTHILVLPAEREVLFIRRLHSLACNDVVCYASASVLFLHFLRLDIKQAPSRFSPRSRVMRWSFPIYVGPLTVFGFMERGLCFSSLLRKCQLRLLSSHSIAS